MPSLVYKKKGLLGFGSSVHQDHACIHLDLFVCLEKRRDMRHAPSADAPCVGLQYIQCVLVGLITRWTTFRVTYPTKTDPVVFCHKCSWIYSCLCIRIPTQMDFI